MTNIDKDEQEITALIENYCTGFVTMNADALKSIWDRDHVDLIYIAMELAEPVRGWDGIEKYYARVAGQFDTPPSMTTDNISIDILGDVAFAYLTWQFASRFRGKTEPHIVDGRVTLVLHRTNEGWKTIHYHESFPGKF